MRQLNFVLAFVLSLCACAQSPLLLTKERRFKDAWWSGFSSRVVEYSSLAHGDGAFYFGTRGGHLYSIAKRSAGCRWKIHLQGSVDTRPLVHRGVIYVGTSQGYAYAVSKTGQIIWQQEKGFYLRWFLVFIGFPLIILISQAYYFSRWFGKKK